MKPLVGIIMGSTSDWETMRHAADMLAALSVPCESRVISAHRTPDLLFEYAGSAAARGLEVIIAGAGGAAHLPGMAASKTLLPVIGVPIQSKAMNGLDSLLSIAQMPAGVPVATVAIGEPGARNAALLATAGCVKQSAPLAPSSGPFKLSGTISSMSGGPIVSAHLIIIDGANKDKHTLTDSSGRYAFTSLESGRFTVVRQTASRRVRAKLRAVKAACQQRWHHPIPEVGRWLASVVRGHINYYAVPRNFEKVATFRNEVIKLWRRGLCRRSQKGHVTWARMLRIAGAHLPRVRIVHPWPEQRLAL